MDSVWFCVHIKINNKTVAKMGRWYDVIFLPRNGDEVVFDDSNDDANGGVVVSVTHWMPHKTSNPETSNDLDEPVSVVTVVMNSDYDESDQEDIAFSIQYDKEQLSNAGFIETDWHFGPPESQQSSN